MEGEWCEKQRHWKNSKKKTYLHQVVEVQLWFVKVLIRTFHLLFALSNPLRKILNRFEDFYHLLHKTHLVLSKDFMGFDYPLHMSEQNMFFLFVFMYILLNYFLLWLIYMIFQHPHLKMIIINSLLTYITWV